MNLSSIKNLSLRKKFAALGAIALAIGTAAALQVSQQNQDNRSKAAEPTQDGYQAVDLTASGGEPEVVPGEVLIKLKSTASFLIPDQINVDNPGIESLRQINKTLGAKQFERVFERTSSFMPQNPSETAWYKVKVATTPNLPTSIKSGTNQAAFAQVLAMVEQYKKDPNVEIVEPNYVARIALTPNDPEYSGRGRFPGYDNLWGLRKINMSSAWDQTTGNNVVVAVIDTGVDGNHPDLRANMTSGWDFVNNDSDPNDDNGHGTHVAGIIGAVGNNAQKIPGVNWRVKIMAVKVLDGTGSGTVDNIAKALRYAADKGAKISNLSLTCPCDSQILNDAVNYEHDRGMTVVAAAGNDNRDVSNNAIANANWAIAVGATDPYDNKASFSNFGPKIDVVAPGVNILSIAANISPMCKITSGGYNYVCWANGTSFSTPQVAGLAALMLSKKPSLGNEEIRQILRNSAKDLGQRGQDPNFGFGLIDAGKALAQVSGSPVVVGPTTRPRPTTRLNPPTAPPPTTNTNTNTQPSPGSKVGLWRSGTWYLHNSLSSGNADNAFGYGNPDDVPLMGDWDGNGTKTPGVYRRSNATFYLKNSNTGGNAEIIFGYGNGGGDNPIVGDWDGNGSDTIGVFRSGTWYLRNSNTSGFADVIFGYGNPNDIALAGDWNNDGKDTPAVWRSSTATFYLKNSNSGGNADSQVRYGSPGDKPIIGDWDNRRGDSIGVYRNGTMYLRNSNSDGSADVSFGYGNPGDNPLVWR